jgi:hypothetical protein
VRIYFIKFITPLTSLVNQPPAPGYLALLLTDGRVMMQSINNAGVFYSLTPAADGSYLNGTWGRLSNPPNGYEPYAGSQAVLADGRVLFVGGEYNQNQGWTLLPNGNLFTIDVGAPPHAEHYDPVAAQWYSDAATPLDLTSPSGTPGGLTYGPAP